jgi:hypothetical protein
MIRITLQKAKKRTVVNIDGRLESLDLEEVQRVRRSSPEDVILNLRGLEGCAEDGIHFLREWLSQGATLVHAVPFVRMRLEQRSQRLPRSQTSANNNIQRSARDSDRDPIRNELKANT